MLKSKLLITTLLSIKRKNISFGGGGELNITIKLVRSFKDSILYSYSLYGQIKQLYREYNIVDMRIYFEY